MCLGGVCAGKIDLMNLADQLAKSNLPSAVRDALLAQLALVEEQAKLAEQQSDQIKFRDQHIAALTLEIAHLRRMRYGVRAESLSAEQRQLFEDTLDSDIAAIEARVEAAAPKAKRERAGRQALPAHLPRTEILHEPDSCNCAACGTALAKIGADVSEQLDYRPGTFRVLRHIRPQYACRRCETVTAAPIPASLIDGGLPTPALLAWIMVSKYVDHLPLYRIAQIAERQGVTLARSTLASWVGVIGFWLQPLADRLAERLRTQTILHADETPVSQLDPGKGKTKNAYLWVYRSNALAAGPPIVVFDYQISRSGQHVRDFLGDWQGRLMVDGYAGYKALFSTGVTELGCWAHARRKFYELYESNQSPIAAEALRRIAALYALESEVNALDLQPEARIAERARRRLLEAKPLLNDFKTWLDQMLLKVAPNSGLAKALNYSCKRWDALVRYSDDGLSPIDNNPVENAIRPIAIGKKNWLFTGSEQSGHRAAAIQTLLGTAKLNGIEPLMWLTETLEKLPTWPNSRIDELLPFVKDQNPQDNEG